MTQATATDADQEAAETRQDADVEVRDAQLGEVTDTGARAGAGAAQIDILLDTTVEIAATLGSTRMPVRQVLELGSGAVITLDRAVGEPVDLDLNGIRFATGRLVVVGDRLGIRIDQILAPQSETPPPAPENGADAEAQPPADAEAQPPAADEAPS